jgi:L-fuconolactonase
VVLEAFGPARVMIGSDWPVCTVAGSYAQVMQVVVDFVRGLSAAEQRAVLGENAMQWYGIRQ